MIDALSSNQTTYWADRSEKKTRYISFVSFVGVLIAACSSQASGMDLWLFNGVCKDSLVNQGSPNVDMRNAPGSVISCDAASIMELDNGRILVQLAQKHGKTLPPGFAGSEFKYTEGNYSLIVDRVYPQQILAGKTTDQIYGEGGKTAMPAEGYCFFSNSDFSKLTDFSCVTKTENADIKILYSVSFKVDDISVKRNLQGFNESSHSAASQAAKGFDRIFEYTMFNQTLPDGKHPVWIYYQTGEKIVRVDMPSLDMCAVTPRSSADWDVIKSKNYDVILKASKDWDFALEIWKAAFQKYMVVGQPKAC
jgi:hypothetical protein